MTISIILVSILFTLAILFCVANGEEEAAGAWVALGIITAIIWSIVVHFGIWPIVAIFGILIWGIAQG